MSAPKLELNGFLGRARELVPIINSLLVAPAVLVYVAAVTSGYLPFRSLDAIARDQAAHREDMAGAMAARQDADRRTAEAVSRLALVVERLERRNRLWECDRFHDPELRRRCLE